MGLLQLREGLFAALVIPGAARWRHTPQLTYKQPERVELVVVVAVVVVCGQHGLGPVCSSVTILTPPHHHLAPPPPPPPPPPQHHHPSTAQHRTCSIPAGCLHSKKVFAPMCQPAVLGNGHGSQMLARLTNETRTNLHYRCD